MARVLVAEDEAVQAKVVQAILEDDGHEVVVTNDGRYALKALVEERFDVVVLDLMMPFTDGFEVLGSLGHGKPKVIVLTAQDDDNTRRRVEKLGVGAYFTKPYDAKELSAKVEEIAGRA